MKSLIRINNITKYFNKKKVIKNFNYTFFSKGLYVLLGSSGSGKSTLLNLLCGLLPFDSGNIDINGKSYSKQVNNKDIKDLVAYITQDSRLVEYLTVLENLKLCSNNMNKIKSFSVKLNIFELLHKLPNELSGGERQRVIFTQFLLLNKQIFLLDEISSSLDYQNKINLFKLLKELGKEKLLIFATHDKEAIKYAIEIVEINKSVIKNSEFENVTFEKSKKPKLYNYINKQNKYKKNIVSKFILLFVFICSLLIVFMCSDIESKMVDSSLLKNHVNYLDVLVPLDYNLDILKDKYNIKEIIYNYRTNLPFNTEDKNIVNKDFEKFIISLPSSSDNFPFVDKIKHGSYFTKEKQIILTYDKALTFSTKPENLIGRKVEINFPDSTEQMEIVGIFNPLSEEEIMYYSGGGIYPNAEGINSMYFLNGSYFNKYIDDEVIGEVEYRLGKIEYFFFFKNKKDLIRFYNDFYREENINNPQLIDVERLGRNYVEQGVLLESIAIYLYPAIFISIITVIAFYMQLKLIDLKYTEFNLGIYVSLGFESKEIKNATLLFHMIEIIKLFIFSLIISLILGFSFNFLNDKFSFTPYILFSFNWKYILSLLILIIILSIIVTLIAFRHLKTDGWLKMSYRGRDLL